MNKIKHFALMLIALVMVLAIPFSSACQTGDTPEPGPGPVTPEPATTELLGIEVDTSKVKTVYYVGEAFTSYGLVVMRETKRSDRDKSEISDITANAVIDSSEFRNRVGEYSINVSYTLGEVTKSDSYSVTVKDASLALDLTNVKTDYLETEEFTSEGLAATVTIISPNAEPVTEDVTSKITVDSSEFKSESGTYPITVNYRLDAVTRSASYSVKVGERKEGLSVTLADGVADTINLSATAPTADIDPSKIVVRTVDYYGNVITTDDGLLSAGDYTVKVFKDGNTTPLTVYTGLTAGVYQIWAYKDSELDQNFELSGFAIIYVVDEITSIVKTAGETEQIAGNDTISDTWQFEAIYASGNKVNLEANDVQINIDTKTVGEDKIATVTYTYVNAKGATKTVTVDVKYTIKAKPVQEGDVTYNMTYQVKTVDVAAKTGGWETKWSNDSEDLDKNVTITTTTANYLTKEKSTTGENAVTFSDYAEVKAFSDKSITINVGAKATNVSITVYASHTSSSSARIIYLANATTAEDSTKVLASATIGGDGNLSTSNLHALTATNLSEGSYYVYTNATTVHVYAVVVEYTIPASETDKPANFTLDAKDISSNSTDTATNIEWGEGVTVTAKAGSTVKVTENSKKMDGLTFTHRLQLGGSGAIDARSIKLELKAAAKITVYGMSSSTGTERTLALYDSTFTAINTDFKNDGNAIDKGIYTTSAADTFYLASTSGGFNVYYIIVEYV